MSRRGLASKSRAAARAAWQVALAAWREPPCSTSAEARSRLAQGKPEGLTVRWGQARWPGAWANMAVNPCLAVRSAIRVSMCLAVRWAVRLAVRWAICLGMPGAALAATPACDLLDLQALARDVWLVPATGAESDARNRGHASHLLLVRDGARLWVVGSGPTPAFGARLRCTARQRLARVPTDVLVPWARAELALGIRGLAAPRTWAHVQVAEAMAEQCATCVDRLRQRLGPAAVDLGDDPVRLPQRRLQGSAGRLGPFDWWVLPRSAGRVVTVLHHRVSGVMSAHGLLWGDGPPDARDADLRLLAEAVTRLPALGHPGTRWVGENGPLLDDAGVRAQGDYLRALRQAAHDALVLGQQELDAPPLVGHEAITGHARHALNWQRAWRQVEPQVLATPPAGRP